MLPKIRQIGFNIMFFEDKNVQKGEITNSSRAVRDISEFLAASSKFTALKFLAAKFLAPKILTPKR